MKLAFAGTPDFAARHLSALLEAPEHEVACVFSQPDRPAGRGRRLSAGAVKRLCAERGIAVHQAASLRDPAAWRPLADCGAEALVVAAYGLLLPAAMLDATRYGGINVHASLLPRWRGSAPVQRAIAHGDARSGVTIMQMDAGLDTGDILDARECPIGPHDDAGALERRLAALGCAALLDTLSALASGGARRRPQDHRLASYAPKLRKAEARLDWRLDADVLERQVRAFNPAPVAFTVLGGERLRVWQARVAAHGERAAPGTVLALRPEGLPVACGQGTLCLVHAQREGQTARAAGALARAFPGRFAPGQRCEGVA